MLCDHFKWRQNSEDLNREEVSFHVLSNYNTTMFFDNSLIFVVIPLVTTKLSLFCAHSTRDPSLLDKITIVVCSL